MRAVLAQLASVPHDPDANAARVAALLAEHPDADLAVLPELFLTGYDPAAAGRDALAPDAPALRAVAEAARRHGTAVVAGHAAREADGTVTNVAACWDADGTLAGAYRKTHLFGDAETAAFAPGDALLVCALAGVAVAPLICFDVEFPEAARAVSRAGAEVLVTVAANMAPYGPDHALAARARALDNRRPHLYVNRPGHEGGHAFTGESAAIAADGTVLAALGAGEDVLVADVDPHAPCDPDTDYLTLLRGDLPVEAHLPIATRGAP